MHTFVIPIDLMISMEAAIKTARIEQKDPDPLEDRIKQQGVVLDLVASIDPKLWKFSGRYVGALTAFYALKAKARAWFECRQWLEQDWSKIEANVDLFGPETGTAGTSADSTCVRHRTMTNGLISMFASTPLSLEFATRLGKGFIAFDNIVGGLCRGWQMIVQWIFVWRRLLAW